MTQNASNNDELYRIAEENQLNDDETGRRYLAIFGAIKRVADNRHVLEDDLRHALYAVGRAFPHDEIIAEARDDYETSKLRIAENSIRYECDEYVVDASEHYFNAFSDVLQNEFVGEEAARADAEAYNEDFEELDASVEEAVEHYRDRLRQALFELMKRADESDSSYPHTYPLVILTDE